MRRLTLALAAAAALSLIPVAAASAAANTDRLNPNEQLNPGERLVSPNGQYVLAMQGDGNLVEYAPGNRAVWASGTGTGNSIARMQGDGNLVVIAPGNAAVWATGTSGNINADVELQNDGNIVVYAQAHLARWSSGTPGSSSLIDRIVTIAQNEAGNPTRNFEDGTDCNYYTGRMNTGAAACGSHAGWRREAWCADFAKYVWQNAGASVSGLGTLANSFKSYGTSRGTWRDGYALTGVQPGDAIVFNQQTATTADDHVGIVTAVSGSSVTMISGNFSNAVKSAPVARISGSQLNGLVVSGYSRPVT